MIRDVHSGSRIRIFFLSRIPGSKKHRMPDPDSQHCNSESCSIKFCSSFKNLASLYQKKAVLWIGIVLMPIWIWIRIGIKMMLILMRILFPSFIHVGKSRQNRPIGCFSEQLPKNPKLKIDALGYRLTFLRPHGQVDKRYGGQIV